MATIDLRPYARKYAFMPRLSVESEPAWGTLEHAVHSLGREYRPPRGDELFFMLSIATLHPDDNPLFHTIASNLTKGGMSFLTGTHLARYMVERKPHWFAGYLPDTASKPQLKEISAAGPCPLDCSDAAFIETMLSPDAPGARESAHTALTMLSNLPTGSHTRDMKYRTPINEPAPGVDHGILTVRGTPHVVYVSALTDPLRAGIILRVLR